MSVYTALNLRNFFCRARTQYLILSQFNRQYHKKVHDLFEADLIGGYEVSTKEMKYVDRLLPNTKVPPLPDNGDGMTPSGWIPPKKSANSLPYFVRRTKNHMLPVYAELKDTNRHLVLIKKIDGDIWALSKDLCKYLEKKYQKKPILSQIHEVGRFIRIKGEYIHDIGDFLISKGF